MPARKQFQTELSVSTDLAELLRAAKVKTVSEDELREQRVSFAFGNTPQSDLITKDSVRRVSMLRCRADRRACSTGTSPTCAWAASRSPSRAAIAMMTRLFPPTTIGPWSRRIATVSASSRGRGSRLLTHAACRRQRRTTHQAGRTNDWCRGRKAGRDLDPREESSRDGFRPGHEERRQLLLQR